jgi:hypothetical protein
MTRAVVTVAAFLALAAPAQAVRHPTRAETRAAALVDVQNASDAVGGVAAHVVKVGRYRRGHWRKAWGVFVLPLAHPFSCPVTVWVGANRQPDGSWLVSAFSVAVHSCR